MHELTDRCRWWMELFVQLSMSTTVHRSAQYQGVTSCMCMRMCMRTIAGGQCQSTSNQCQSTSPSSNMLACTALASCVRFADYRRPETPSPTDSQARSLY